MVALPVVCGGRRCYWGAEGGRGGGASPFPSSPSSASFFFLFFSSFLFSSLLFSLPSPLCSSLVLFSLFSWSPLFFPGSCFFISPVFIEKQGRDTAGAPLCCRPSNTWKAFGQVGVLGQHLFDAFERKKVGENRGKKNLLLPLPRSSRGRRRPTVPSKRHRFGLFFW